MPSRPTRDALRQAGVDARSQLPIATQAEWKPAADRADPVTLLEEQAATRIPELVPVRYGRMAVSAFTFYRGGAAIMAGDLALTPSSRLRALLCGDCHVANFGLYGTPERNLLF